MSNSHVIEQPTLVLPVVGEHKENDVVVVPLDNDVYERLLRIKDAATKTYEHYQEEFYAIEFWCDDFVVVDASCVPELVGTENYDCVRVVQRLTISTQEKIYSGTCSVWRQGGTHGFFFSYLPPYGDELKSVDCSFALLEVAFPLSKRVADKINERE